MLYSLYEAGFYAASPLRAAARLTRDFWSSPLNPAREASWAGGSTPTPTCSRTSRAATASRPGASTPSRSTASRCACAPTEEWSSPWCKLTHFARDMADMRRAGRRTREPAVLIAAPLSGHYATLLRGTVRPSCRTTRSTSPSGPTPATCR